MRLKMPDIMLRAIAAVLPAALALLSVSSCQKQEALHYSPESLSCGAEKEQLHFPEIEPDTCVWLCIDGVQMGLGCVDSWGALPRHEYRIPYEDLTFRFRLAPARLLR